MIYLDHNATTPLCREAMAAMQAVWEQPLGNASSQHSFGRKARRILENARNNLLNRLGGSTQGMAADQLIFTSGGTEANNLAILGLARDPEKKVLISAIEHPSVKASAAALLDHDIDVQLIRVRGNGEINLDEFRAALNSDVQLASVMWANHETGVIQPIAEIAELCRERGILLHIDAVQAVGKIPVHFREIGASCLTIAAHKFHGPCGIGALLLANDITPEPQLHGGFQQAGLRPGTEAVALAAGMNAALDVCLDSLDERHAHMATLRDEFEQTITSALPNTVINGAEGTRLPHVANLAFVDVDRQALLMALDLAGVACSTGSACASGSSEPSPVLYAMGLPPEVIAASMRFSLGAGTTATEIEDASSRIIKCVNDLRAQKSGR